MTHNLSPSAIALALFMENEQSLLPQLDSILKNQARRMKRGKYDASEAAKLWKYWTDSGNTLHKKTFGQSFLPDVRWEAARYFRDYYADEIKELSKTI